LSKSNISSDPHLPENIAESTLALEYVDYFFNVICTGAETKKSELLRLSVRQLIMCDFVEMPDESLTGYGWSTDPGAVDNIAGEKTKAAVKAFQRNTMVKVFTRVARVFRAMQLKRTIISQRRTGGWKLCFLSRERVHC
jgi:hypothetical protein